MFTISWIQNKIKEGTANENSFIHIHYIHKEKSKKKKQWNCRWEKMSKAIEENELTIMIKKAFTRIQFILEIYENRQK